ncbi:CPBP family glutamic-type intramembrane protease [Sporosarcina aquimarina]|uniref:CPBP family glutamic-type intramembrane protease n=1 Tax=Sporosarcina aquimarina TaxID=114975 RepID=UPI002040B0BD|nr:CPBP family glutamic-type intramembrane protease [Sporosarcina aquimarina]
MKIIGLEVLVIFFFTVNGIFVSISEPSNEFLKYLGIVPLAIGILSYLFITKKWKFYFSKNKLFSLRKSLLLSGPLVLIVILLFIGNGGIASTPISTLLVMLVTQIAVVAFVEEMVIRGFMLNMLCVNNVKVAVFVSSGLFAITHSLQLLSGHWNIPSYKYSMHSL